MRFHSRASSLAGRRARSLGPPGGSVGLDGFRACLRLAREHLDDLVIGQIAADLL